jgi:hypothetical protein
MQASFLAAPCTLTGTPSGLLNEDVYDSDTVYKVQL